MFDRLPAVKESAGHGGPVAFQPGAHKLATAHQVQVAHIVRVVFEQDAGITHAGGDEYALGKMPAW